MKYIVFRNQVTDEEEIFLFPKSVDHDVFAESMGFMRNHTWGNWERIRRTPISAGFVDANQCWGKSESLNLVSRPEDSNLLI